MLSLFLQVEILALFSKVSDLRVKHLKRFFLKRAEFVNSATNSDYVRRNESL
jgi:hypothetical protein